MVADRNHDSRAASEPRARLRAIALLPSAATLSNAASGVLAILCGLLSIATADADLQFALKHPILSNFFSSYIVVGCYLIGLAMVFDVLDGRLARMTRRTSEFGAQLDSLADMISFGVAPGVLALTLLLQLRVGSLEWRLDLLCVLVFVCCAAIRLARFNVESVASENASKSFSGLPTPAAAGAVVTFLLLYWDLAHHEETQYAGELAIAFRFAIGPLIFAIGLLMVARVEFVHVVNALVSREHPPRALAWLLAIAAIGWIKPQLMLAVLAFGYVVGGLVVHWRRQRPGRDDADQATAARPNGAVHEPAGSTRND